ncbi:glycosyltransferase [Dyella sedimenti]|uniref:glycosyltransferase n=1 Tax=Dyella sedimenti TaxID=2919947 RepID=UPI001FAB2A60|nr:glycosyltransferase [Dyella sedimenti]
MEKKPYILFLTRSLARGGAERQLVLLASGLHRKGWRVEVACFYAGGAFQRELEQSGVSVIDLAKRGRWDLPGFLWRFCRLIRKRQPDIVHGYLPVPNMLSLGARILRPDTKVVWGVRASNIDLVHYDWLSHLTFRMQCRLSRMAALIIANSSAGLEYHAARGFPREKMKVVPNGIDTARFRFDVVGRERMREKWDVPQRARLVGLVGRLDPMKDHANFLDAVARLQDRLEDCWFVCIGDGATSYQAELARLADTLGLRGRVIWAGACDDMPAAYSALDIVVSSSKGEGFPNVVAEAMSCGRPCVVTDVGDSAMLVGETGVIVPPGNSKALAMGIETLCSRLSDDCQAMSDGARDRITDHFGRESLIDATRSLIQGLVSDAAGH